MLTTYRISKQWDAPESKSDCGQASLSKIVFRLKIPYQWLVSPEVKRQVTYKPLAISF